MQTDRTEPTTPPDDCGYVKMNNAFIVGCGAPFLVLEGPFRDGSSVSDCTFVGMAPALGFLPRILRRPRLAGLRATYMKANACWELAAWLRGRQLPQEQKIYIGTRQEQG